MNKKKTKEAQAVNLEGHLCVYIYFIWLPLYRKQLTIEPGCNRQMISWGSRTVEGLTAKGPKRGNLVVLGFGHSNRTTEPPLPYMGATLCMNQIWTLEYLKGSMFGTGFDQARYHNEPLISIQISMDGSIQWQNHLPPPRPVSVKYANNKKCTEATTLYVTNTKCVHIHKVVASLPHPLKVLVQSQTRRFMCLMPCRCKSPIIGIVCGWF